MNPSSFSCWLLHREHADHHVPHADAIIPMISQAGAAGMNRKQIGSVVSLDRDALDELLVGLVNFGLLTLTWEDGVPVFRAPGTA